MIELNAGKLAERRHRARDRQFPVIVPLGQDHNGVWHYRVVSLRPDGSVSDHATCFVGVEFGGCTCEAGQHHNHCVHVAWSHPVHQTFVKVASWLWPQL